MSTAPALFVLGHDHPVGAGTPLHSIFPVEQGAKAVEEALRGAAPDTTLLLYVHGRGAGPVREPDKSLIEILPALENQQNVRVVMFFWPGSAEGGILGFPEKPARAAANDLGRALRSLGPRGDRRRSMLVHSLGSIVVEEYLQRHHAAGSFAKSSFDAVTFSAAASEARPHADWLRRLDFSARTFVVVNENDKVLSGAGLLEWDARLGRELPKSIAGIVTLASNAEYVDIRGTGANHRYFVRDGQDGSPVLKAFFDGVLIGRPTPWDDLPGERYLEQRDATSVHYLWDA